MYEFKHWTNVKKKPLKHNETSKNLDQNENIINKISTNYNLKGHQKKFFNLKIKIKCMYLRKISKIKNQIKNWTQKKSNQF